MDDGSAEKSPISSTESTLTSAKNNEIEKTSNPIARSLPGIVNSIKSLVKNKALLSAVVTIILAIIANGISNYLYDEKDTSDHKNEINHMELLIKNIREQLANGSFTSAVFSCKSAQNTYKELFGSKADIDTSKINGTIQMHLGDAYLGLANCEDIEKNLDNAIDVYNSALGVLTSNDKEYIHIKLNLGNSYCILSKIRDKKKNAEEAIKSYNSALEYRSSEKPRECIQIETGLGNAYRLLSEVEEKENNSLSSIKHYENALELNKDDNHSLTYSDIKCYLGIDYRSLSEVRNREENLEKALRNHSDALNIRELSNDPISYAQCLSNLATVYRSLYEVERNPKRLEIAIDYYKTALDTVSKGLPMECYRIQYADIKNNLGIAYYSRYEFAKNNDDLNSARDAYLDALDIRLKNKYPIDYAQIMNNIGVINTSASEIFSKKEKKLELLNNALRDFDEALQISHNESAIDYSETKHNQGVAYINMFRFTDNKMYLELAKSSFEKSLEIRTLEDNPLDFALTKYYLGNVFLCLAESNDNEDNIGDAIDAYKESLDIYKIEDPVRYNQVYSNYEIARGYSLS